MTKKVLRALMGSIKKWEKIVEKKGIDAGANNCPLCMLFEYVSCEGLDGTPCPVLEKTGKLYCGGTPYKKWASHQRYCAPVFDINTTTSATSISGGVNCPECKRLAKQELRFLKSLLPKEKKK